MNDGETCVLLVDMPRLVRDLMEDALRRAAGLTPVVRENLDELPAAARSTGAEFVVVGVAEGGVLPPQAASLLDDAARRKLLGIEYRDGRAFLYELRPTTTPLGEVEPDGLVATIRARSAGA